MSSGYFTRKQRGAAKNENAIAEFCLQRLQRGGEGYSAFKLGKHQALGDIQQRTSQPKAKLGLGGPRRNAKPQLG